MEIYPLLLLRPCSFTQMIEYGYRDVCVLVNMNILLSHQYFLIRNCYTELFSNARDKLHHFNTPQIIILLILPAFRCAAIQC